MDAVQKSQLERVALLPLVLIFLMSIGGAVKRVGRMGSQVLTPRLSAVNTPARALMAQPTKRSSSAKKSSGSAAAITYEFDPQYTAQAGRDPLKSLLPEEPVLPPSISAASQHAAGDSIAAEPPALHVEGMVWGSQLPQVVIGGEVYTVGDTVGEAKIMGIDRAGIEVEYHGSRYRLAPN